MARYITPYAYAFGESGEILPYAKLWFYESGTTTPKNTYTTPALDVANTNPVIANGVGVFPSIWLGGGQYKVVYTDENDAQLWTADPVDSQMIELGEPAYYEGNGTTREFALPAEWEGLASNQSLLITFDGFLQEPRTFECTAEYIVFEQAPPDGVSICARPGIVGPRGPEGAGDVVGPSSSINNEIALFNGTTGKLIKRGVTYNNIPVTATGTVTSRTVADRWSTVLYASDMGIIADGVTDNSDALDAMLLEADSRGGGIIVMPIGVIRTTRQWTWGNGSNSQPSQYGHRIFLMGQGIGASAGYTNVQGQGVTVIRYDGAVDTNAAVLEFAGPLLNVGYSNIEFDCNSKAGTGVRHIHVANSHFDRPCVKNWTTLALDFTTRNGFPTGCAYGCADNLLIQPYVMEPTNFTGNGLQMTAGVNTASTLVGAPDTARLIVDGGTIFYGGNAGSIGCLIYGADNNTMRRTLILQKGGSTGAGVGVEFRQWPGSTTFPLENRLEDVVPIGGITGPGGTLGNWVILPASDGATITNRGDIVLEQYDGKTYGTQPYIKAVADGQGLRLDAAGTIVGAILRRTNDVRHTSIAGNLVFSAASSTETGGNDDFTVLPNEARARVAGAGNGFTGYVGSTFIYGLTRDGSNGLRLAALTDVTVYAGASTATGGTAAAQFASTGNVSLAGIQGSESLRAVPTASAVNRVEIAGSVTGAGVQIRSAGSDANINLVLNTQGTGNVFLRNGGVNVLQAVGVSGDTRFIQVIAGTTAVTLGAAGGGNTDLALNPQGTGLIRIGTTSTAAATPASFSADRALAIKDSSGTTYYIPLATATW